MIRNTIGELERAQTLASILVEMLSGFPKSYFNQIRRLVIRLPPNLTAIYGEIH